MQLRRLIDRMRRSPASVVPEEAGEGTEFAEENQETYPAQEEDANSSDDEFYFEMMKKREDAINQMIASGQTKEVAEYIASKIYGNFERQEEEPASELFEMVSRSYRQKEREGRFKK